MQSVGERMRSVHTDFGLPDEKVIAEVRRCHDGIIHYSDFVRKAKQNILADFYTNSSAVQDEHLHFLEFLEGRGSERCDLRPEKLVSEAHSLLNFFVRLVRLHPQDLIF